MNATKRKFNALLNGIGTSPKDVNKESAKNMTPIAPWEAEWQAKRRKRAANDTSSSINSSQTRQTVLHKKSKSIANPAQLQRPKYAPWDRAEFLNRLKSFRDIHHWSPKPERVNEVEWAKRGWLCQKDERVRCCLCNVEILVKLNKKVVDGKEEPVYIAHLIEDALVDKYVELIITSHQEDCLWRHRGCDDSIFKIPLNDGPLTIENLKARYTQLGVRKETLPYYFNLRNPPGFDLDTVLKQLPKDFSTIIVGDESHSSEVNKTALVMAIFGWQGHKDDRLGEQLQSVCCHACYRVLGLWLFKSKEVNAAGEETLGAAMNCLDVKKEHRSYCPWANAASQSGYHASATVSGKAVAGWEVMLRVIKNEYYTRTNNGPQSFMSLSPTSRVSEATDFGNDIDDANARSIRDEKDKERWARLRRVKSLFDTKAGKKQQLKGKPKP